jgi:sarcosine oxidase, subunit beta
VLAASHCPSDGCAEPVSTTQAFAGAARRYGADIREGCGAHAIVVRNGRIAGVESGMGFLSAERVIVAAGTHAPGLLAPLGLRLPQEVTQVQVVQTEPATPCFDQVFGVANADCAGRQEADGRFRYTTGVRSYPGDAEHWTEEALRPSDADIAVLRGRVRRVLPIAAETPVATVWGGLIDLTPDHLPVLDAPAAIPGLVIAAGFSGHGFGIAPATGRIAADLATGETPLHDLSAFRLDRFHSHAGLAQPAALHG